MSMEELPAQMECAKWDIPKTIVALFSHSHSDQFRQLNKIYMLIICILILNLVTLSEN